MKRESDWEVIIIYEWEITAYKIWKKLSYNEFEGKEMKWIDEAVILKEMHGRYINYGPTSQRDQQILKNNINNNNDDVISQLSCIFCSYGWRPLAVMGKGAEILEGIRGAGTWKWGEVKSGKK